MEVQQFVYFQCLGSGNSHGWQEPDSTLWSIGRPVACLILAGSRSSIDTQCHVAEVERITGQQSNGTLA
jgi:hypothetical protein